MRKVIKVFISIIIMLLFFYSIFFILQNHEIKNALEKYNEAELNDEHALIRCNYNIMEPEFAYVFFAMNQGHISFDQINKIFWKAKDWKTSSTGGTTIKNTTFPELVEMVKDDCSQFQGGHGDFYGEDLAWSYSPAPTQKELDRRHILSLRSEYKYYSPEVIEIFNSIYNVEREDILLDDNGALKISNKIEEDGGLHPDVQAQLKLEEDEYQRKVESGEIVIPTTEEVLRRKGSSEDIIKIAVEAKGETYIGPK